MDATGNRFLNHTAKWSGDNQNYRFTFSPSLWPGEAPWKIKCHIKPVHGLTAGEQFSFKNVPLGEAGERVKVGWNTNIQGISVTLNYLLREPASGHSQVHLSFAQGPDDARLTLLAAATDEGTDLTSECVEKHNKDECTLHFPRLPPGAKALSLTFGLPRSRVIEFLAKPGAEPARLKTQ